MKRIASSFGVLVLLLAALSFAVANTAPSDPPAARDAVVHSTNLLAGSEEAVCSAESEQASDLAPTALAATGPHCCGSGAGAACRDQCKLQGPGCKGTIGCRAGECVCTCSCP